MATRKWQIDKSLGSKGGRKWLKKWVSRWVRRWAKRDPEGAPRKPAYRGYE